MRRYLIFYKTEIKTFSSCTYPYTEYLDYNSMVMEGNSAGEVFDEFYRQQSALNKDIGTTLTGTYNQILVVSDLGEIIKDEPVEPVKEKTENTIDEWVKELEG